MDSAGRQGGLHGEFTQVMNNSAQGEGPARLGPDTHAPAGRLGCERLACVLRVFLGLAGGFQGCGLPGRLGGWACLWLPQGCAISQRRPGSARQRPLARLQVILEVRQ